MCRATKSIAIFVGVLLLTGFNTTAAGAGGPNHSNRHLRAGAVYVLTNQTTNQVAAFRRNANGSLTPVGMFPTGGAGDPVPQGMDPATDPLASQGALIMSPGNRFLFAVNAGSNQISVLKIRNNDLERVALVNSGGIRPISLTYHDGLLYVLNEGGTPNITGFTVAGNGRLTPLANSTRPLLGGAAADPAQVSFSPDGVPACGHRENGQPPRYLHG